MYLQRLAMINFRNYKQLDVKFEKGIVYLLGDNGVGKTNLLESIYYISNLESFRTNEDKNLVNDFKGQFRLESIVDGVDYKLNISPTSKDLQIDGIEYKKYREYLGRVNVIEFVPDQVYLFKDSPKDRRKFLDKELSKLDKVYLENLLIYNKLLKQRNELLKSSTSYKEKLFEIIDEKMSKLQKYIIDKRIQFLNNLEEELKYLNDDFEITLKYNCFVEEVSEIEILKKYKDSYLKDKEKLSTSIGIQRDDFEMYVNGVEISNYASQGEQRYCVLLLKLSLAKFIKKTINKDPIIILDDVFSELDNNRKEKIYNVLKEYEQVFISGCLKENLKMSVYKVEKGKVSLIKED